MKSADKKAKSLELQLKDFTPIAGLFRYNRRKIEYMMDECKTTQEHLKITLSTFPRYGIIVIYNLGLLHGLEYLIGYLGKRL